MTPESNMDALLAFAPMIVLLIAAFFRLDELFVKVKRTSVRPTKIAGLDENGRPICLDPDGRRFPRLHQRGRVLASDARQSRNQ